MNREVTTVLLKISSAIEELDSLNATSETNSHFKGGFKNMFNKFFEFYIQHSKYLVIAQEKASPKVYKGLVYDMASFMIEVVDADTEELKNLGMLVAKLNSAASDLQAIERSVSNDLFTRPLLSRMNTMLTKKFVKNLPNSKAGMEQLQRYVNKIYSI